MWGRNAFVRGESSDDHEKGTQYVMKSAVPTGPPAGRKRSAIEDDDDYFNDSDDEKPAGKAGAADSWNPALPLPLPRSPATPLPPLPRSISPDARLEWIPASQRRRTRIHWTRGRRGTRAPSLPSWSEAGSQHHELVSEGWALE